MPEPLFHLERAASGESEGLLVLHHGRGTNEGVRDRQTNPTAIATPARLSSRQTMRGRDRVVGRGRFGSAASWA